MDLLTVSECGRIRQMQAEITNTPNTHRASTIVPVDSHAGDLIAFFRSDRGPIHKHRHVKKGDLIQIPGQHGAFAEAVAVQDAILFERFDDIPDGYFAFSYHAGSRTRETMLRTLQEVYGRRRRGVSLKPAYDGDTPTVILLAQLI